MGEEYSGLRLNLGLKCGESSILQSISMNLMQSGSMATQPSLQSPSINGVQTSIERDNETIASYDGFDLNLPMIATEGDNMVVLPSNSVTLNNGRNINDNEENDEGDNHAKKKMRFSIEQVALLEDTFKEHNFPDQKQKSDLAKMLNLTLKQVEVWFQNKRGWLRMKQNEIEVERLKIYYDTLKKENEMLKKEIYDIQVQNISYHSNFGPTPAFFVVCPNCDKVKISPSLSSTSTLSALSSCNCGIKHRHEEPDIGSSSKRN